MPIKDSFIAATALVHDLVVATRNRAGFEKACVGVIDPFAIDRPAARVALRRPT